MRIGTLGGLGQRLHLVESSRVGVERQVLQATWFEAGRGGAVARGGVVENHLVEAGRKVLDRSGVVQDGAMLAPRHARRHEDAEVAHLLVQQVDDTLAGSHQVLGRGKHFLQPAQRLVRRRDVVAVGAEDHQRRPDALEIRTAMAVDHDLPVLEAVADEQLPGDGQHLLSCELVEAVPPALELQEAIALGLDGCAKTG